MEYGVYIKVGKIQPGRAQHPEDDHRSGNIAKPCLFVVHKLPGASSSGR